LKDQRKPKINGKEFGYALRSPFGRHAQASAARCRNRGFWAMEQLLQLGHPENKDALLLSKSAKTGCV
jgi:hypothetical protein